MNYVFIHSHKPAKVDILSHPERYQGCFHANKQHRRCKGISEYGTAPPTSDLTQSRSDGRFLVELHFFRDKGKINRVAICVFSLCGSSVPDQQKVIEVVITTSEGPRKPELDENGWKRRRGP